MWGGVKAETERSNIEGYALVPFTKRRTKPGSTRPRLTVRCGVRSSDCICIVENVQIISTAPEKQRVVECVACINAAAAKVTLCALLVSCGINHLRGGIIKQISSLFSTINMAAFKQLECIVCFWWIGAFVLYVSSGIFHKPRGEFAFFWIQIQFFNLTSMKKTKWRHLRFFPGEVTSLR